MKETETDKHWNPQISLFLSQLLFPEKVRKNFLFLKSERTVGYETRDVRVKPSDQVSLSSELDKFIIFLSFCLLWNGDNNTYNVVMGVKQ